MASKGDTGNRKSAQSIDKTSKEEKGWLEFDSDDSIFDEELDGGSVNRFKRTKESDDENKQQQIQEIIDEKEKLKKELASYDFDSTDIYKPSEKDMKIQYPDIMKYEELALLKDAELKFVWYYSCKSSPYANLQPDKRVEAAISASKIEDRAEVNFVSRLRTLSFDEKIKAAMNVMATFMPRYRSRARKLNETMFTNLEAMARLTDTEIALMTSGEKSQYVSFAKTAMQVVPDLINSLENSNFGVSSIKKAKAEKGKTIMDRAIEEDGNN